MEYDIRFMYSFRLNFDTFHSHVDDADTNLSRKSRNSSQGCRGVAGLCCVLGKPSSVQYLAYQYYYSIYSVWGIHSILVSITTQNTDEHAHTNACCGRLGSILYSKGVMSILDCITRQAPIYYGQYNGRIEVGVECVLYNVYYIFT